MALTLVVGSKHVSSWSLRPWLAMRQAGIPFDERVILLDRPTTHDEIALVSPSGRVPVLVDGSVRVWDSLAICEYVAEAFPDSHSWPADREARAVAPAVSPEMHAGFAALRRHLPFDLHRTGAVTPPPDAAHDITRIASLWSECRSRFGQRGPFLFGAFSIADAMYAPVVVRLQTYGVSVDGAARDYVETISRLPALDEWLAAGRAEEPLTSA